MRTEYPNSARRQVGWAPSGGDVHLNRSSHAIRWIAAGYLLIAAAAPGQNTNTQQVKKPTPPSAPPLVATAIPAPAAVATPAPRLKTLDVSAMDPSAQACT